MKQTIRKPIFPKAALLIFLLALTGSVFGAETITRIESRWKPSEQLNVEPGSLVSSPTEPGWYSAQWVLEPVGDNVHFRIKNRWKNTYLHNENKRLEAGSIQKGWFSAMWELENAGDGFHRLKNRYTGEYIHIEKGNPQVGKADPGWYSAMWKLDGYGAGSTNKQDSPVASALVAERQLQASPISDKPVNHYTYLGVHNVVASYAYGYAFQNSQRYDVTTQLDGGARMLEIDIVYDTPDDIYEAGVYVCHCGQAPHSTSSRELKRAKNKMSKIPLPFWTAGAKYLRFQAVLGAVDKWLIAHPNEIVFVVTENNSATVAQFDKEVAAARIRTGIYVKPDNQTTWPGRAELIKANKRLIFLAHDGVDLSASRYANKKSLTKWKGYLKPEFYGAENNYLPAAGEEDKFLSVGSFTGTLTDAITARYYNDYTHLKKRKDEWIAKGYTRFPTFIQVNQLQIADPLRIVNEINGPSYQVTATVPKDPVGNWIVNASADIGSAIVSVSKDVKTFVTGDVTPTGARAIKFNNQAGYVAKMTVFYHVMQDFNGITVPIPKTLETPKITLGFTRPLVIPTNIRRDFPIVVTIKGVATVKNPVFSTTVPADFTGELCFKSWGTIFNAQGGKCN